MTALETLQALEAHSFTPEALQRRLLDELRILSDAFREQLLRFGSQPEEGEGVLNAIMVAQAYCINRLLELNGKVTLADALERYAETEVENYATAASLDADRAHYRAQTLRCDATPIQVGDTTYYRLFSPIDQRTQSYQHIPAHTWMPSARRALPRMVEFILHGRAIDTP